MNGRGMKALVLFDLDGTLVDSAVDLLNALNV
ncbi:MAG: phosphoglycolate phosphatase, partial [Frankiaceae bacterium]|nr:phosphoglycolate phosphatase [Arenimonas sp.]